MNATRRNFLLARSYLQYTRDFVAKRRFSRQFVSLSTRGLKSNPDRFRKSLLVKRAGTFAVGITGGFVVAKFIGNFNENNRSTWSMPQCECLLSKDEETQNVNRNGERKQELQVRLYQYQNCPFCCKVRAFLDYYGIEYEKVEVNPLLKREIKFSEYRKVPIVIVEGVDEEKQLNDSSLIISVLRSHMLGKGAIEDLLVYYPKIEVEGSKSKKFEYQNRHNVMYMEAMPTKEQADAVREELKWRRWVDDKLVHMLSPNIYRTVNEAYQAFDYFSSVGNFGSMERFFAKNCGAVFMYVVSKRLKSRYNLKDDVRQSLYEEVNSWVKAVGKKRRFMGGDKPNLADLGVYGVLSAIEGLDAFEDMMKNTNVKPWYNRMKKAVTNKQGQKEYLALMARLN